MPARARVASKPESPRTSSTSEPAPFLPDFFLAFRRFSASFLVSASISVAERACALSISSLYMHKSASAATTINGISVVMLIGITP